MNLQYISLSIPFDFIEQLIQTQHVSKVRSFTALARTKGDFNNCSGDETPCKITVTRHEQHVNVTLHSDRFQIETSTASCHFAKWTEMGNEGTLLKKQVNPQAKDSVPKTSTAKNTGPGGSLRKRKAPKNDIPHAKNEGSASPKRKIQLTNIKGLTHKVVKYAVTSQNPSEQNDSESKVSESSKMDVLRSINLRPRVSKVNWSALEEDSGEESGDSFHPDDAYDGNDDDDDNGESEKQKTKTDNEGSPAEHEKVASLACGTQAKDATFTCSAEEPDSQVKYGPLLVVSGSQVSEPQAQHVQGPRGTLKTLLPKAGVVKPVIMPVLPPKISARRTIKKQKKIRKILPKTNSSSESYKPVNKIVTRIAKLGKGTPVMGSVVNIPASFPLQDCPGKLIVVESCDQTEECHLTLVPSGPTDNDVVKVIEPVRVSFYTNISKGVESHPYSYPKEFTQVSVEDDAAILIVISLRKIPLRKYQPESWRKKLAAIQEITGPIPEDDVHACLAKDDSEKDEDSLYVSHKRNLLTAKLSALKEKLSVDIDEGNLPVNKKSPAKGKTSLRYKLAAIRRKPGALATLPEQSETQNLQRKKRRAVYTGRKLCALKEKMSYEPEGGPVLDDITSSSDSESDYEDEVELLKIPELSVVYSKTIDLNKGYALLKEGNNIPLIDFRISSTELLKAPGNRFYIQGTKEDIDGMVLLGPFSMEYNPRPYLNFIRISEPQARIPKHIYERRRQRWLRKQARKPFTRPTGGFIGNQGVAFVDHDYCNIVAQESPTAQPSKETDDVNEDQRGITLDSPVQSEDVILISTKGLDVDTLPEGGNDSLPYIQQEMPVIRSLEDAMMVQNRQLDHCNVPANIADSIYEPVSFDALPPVTVEATLNSTGIQINSRVLRRRRDETSTKPDEKPTLPVTNDDSVHIPLKYTCKYCLKAVSNNFRLSDHIKLAHRNQQGFMDYAKEVLLKEGTRCKYCKNEIIFFSRDGLRAHVNVHHPEKVTERPSSIAKRTCPTCKKVFSQRGVLKKHIQRIHVMAQFLCDRCPGIFKSEQALTDHIKGKHDNIRNSICDICGASYVTDTYLRKHIKNVHNKRKRPIEEGSPKTSGRGAPGKPRGGVVKKCFLCGYTFDTVNLKKHLKQIHGVQPKDVKKCGECSLTFNNRAELEYHRYAAHEYEYDFNCPYCGDAYILRRALNDHILTFHYSLNLYQCYLCEKNCLKSHNLTEHMMEEHKGVQAHDEDRKLTCHHCPEIFKTHKCLLDHLFSFAHEDVFQHKCLTCQQGFMHEPDLEHHIKIVHGKDRHTDFEIRCHSNTDKIVHMLVNQDIKEIGDLPPKAQLALKRLHSQGKQVMIVSKLHSEKERGMPKSKPVKRTKSVQKKINPVSKYLPNPVSASLNMQRNEPVQNVNLKDVSNNVGSAVSTSITKTEAAREVISPRSGPEAEVLKVYRMAVQSEEVAKAVESVSHHQQQQQEQVEEKVLSVDDEFVVAEQIGRIDESGNILEDRVVYVDEGSVSEDLLMMLQSQSLIQMG